MADEIHKDDIGTTFEATLKDGGTVADLSSATTKDFRFRKPDGTIVTKATSFVTDGTDGKLKYTTVSGDLDVAGKWNLEAYIILSSGEWTTDRYNFEVFDTFA